MTDLTPSSMADVAARAGVSISTVSRALRGSPLVSPDTTRQVVQAA
jgi:LacI family transcriptional regulator, repressor for deo operon, udp, cdd, tsx, nupC, and nupG